jgi:hypothetical protein
MTPLTTMILWLIVLLVIAAAVALAAFAWRLGRRSLAFVAAGLLLAALVLESASLPTAPLPIALSLGVLAAGLAVVGGGPIAVATLQVATRGSVPSGAHGGILVDEATDPERPERGATTHEVLRGGLTIGILERIAVVGAIIGGFPAAVAVVVALKSVGRFTELGAAEARERFIIGTLASLIWACACGAVVVLSW